MSQIASDAKISSAMSKLGMTAPLPNLDDSQVLKAILVALGNVTAGGGGGGGSGNVVGPANSTDGDVALFDGVTGKLIKDEGIASDNLALRNVPNAFAADGAASTPAMALTGSVFSGGNTATTKPLALIEPSGTTSAGWDTAGTGIGVNLPTAFAGNALDIQKEGVSVARFRSDGSLFANSVAISSVYDSSGANAIINVAFLSGVFGISSPAFFLVGPMAWAASQVLAGDGAVDLITTVTKFTSSGANALTLADGEDGQMKVIVSVAAGAGVLTPATPLGFTTLTFNNAGDTVTLIFNIGIGWAVLSSKGTVIA